MRSLSEIYKSSRRKIDVRHLLEYYQAENLSESVGSDGHTWIRHSCLLDRVEPHHSHGDANPSAQICVETGSYVCFAYWSGDVFHLIAKLEGEEFAGETVGRLIFGAHNSASFRKEIDRIFTEPVYSVDIPSYSDAVLAPWARSHPYMTQVRGISHHTCEALRIGFDPAVNRIVFPHWWQGKLVGWQKRIIPESEDWPGTLYPYPKYKNSTGFPKSETLYNYDLAKNFRDVIVVESPMSVAKAEDLGLSDMRLAATVATFGAKVSKTQISLLGDFEHVYIWFDDDLAGRGGERKLVEGLYRQTKVWVVTPDEDRDLGDCDAVSEVRRKLEEARPANLWLGDLRGRRGGS